MKHGGVNNYRLPVLLIRVLWKICILSHVRTSITADPFQGRRWFSDLHTYRVRVTIAIMCYVVCIESKNQSWPLWLMSIMNWITICWRQIFIYFSKCLRPKCIQTERYRYATTSLIRKSHTRYAFLEATVFKQPLRRNTKYFSMILNRTFYPAWLLEIFWKYFRVAS